MVVGNFFRDVLMICVNNLGAIHNVQGIKPVIVYDTILPIAKSLVYGSFNTIKTYYLC